MIKTEIEDIVQLIVYKQGWTVQLHEDRERPYLQVHYDGTGEYGKDPWTGRKWTLSQHMTKTEIVCTAFKAVMAEEEHETREIFKYKGHEVFGPHFDVDDIVRCMDQGALHPDVRENAMQGAG